MIMASNFYTSLAERSLEGFNYENVRRWTKEDIFDADHILIPIFCGDKTEPVPNVYGHNHWTLCVIDRNTRRFEYYDSKFGPARSVLRNLRKWFAKVSLSETEQLVPTLDLDLPL